MADAGTAVIVGVGTGLGAALCRRFAKAGHGIAMAARKADKLGSLVDEIVSGGGRAKAYAVDATEEEEVIGLFTAAENDLGPAVVAVYNAGARVHKSFLDLEAGEFERVWRTSCLGGMLTGREAARRMVEQGSGTILFTGGRGSRRADAMLAAFAVGKFGLRAVAHSMARELGPKGIHVAHIVVEGGIDNESMRQRVPNKIAEDGLISTDALAEVFYQTHLQHRSTWALEVDVRPWKEPF